MSVFLLIFFDGQIRLSKKYHAVGMKLHLRRTSGQGEFEVGSDEQEIGRIRGAFGLWIFLFLSGKIYLNHRKVLCLPRLDLGIPLFGNLLFLILSCCI